MSDTLMLFEPTTLGQILGEWKNWCHDVMIEIVDHLFDYLSNPY
jgi:hypothetical protein